MKISYSIMAHPKREYFAKDIAKKLNCSIFWDKDNNIWNTCKGSWLLAENSDYHFVIQDDAILCKNFKKVVKDFITKSIKENGETAFQLYFGRNSNVVKKEKAINGCVISDICAWGVAIGIPTRLIKEMITFGNGYNAWQDDVKIKYYLKSKGIKTVFPVPCFVDHRELETLTPCPIVNKENRTSEVFLK